MSGMSISRPPAAASSAMEMEDVLVVLWVVEFPDPSADVMVATGSPDEPEPDAESVGLLSLPEELDPFPVVVAVVFAADDAESVLAAGVLDLDIGEVVVAKGSEINMSIEF